MSLHVRAAIERNRARRPAPPCARWVLALAVFSVSSRAAAQTTATCPQGQLVTPRTAGHCCWPGQHWWRSHDECSGTPHCPAGFDAVHENCVAHDSAASSPASGPSPTPDGATCPPGQRATMDTRGHCCWPDQAWSVVRATCVGAPSCPPGFAQNGDSCTPPAARAETTCPPGESITVDTAGHCCWPAQAWSVTRAMCIGRPTCPPGFALQGEACVASAPPPTQCPAGQVTGTDTQGHCCWPQQAWSITRATCIGAPACPSGLVAQGEACVGSTVAAPSPAATCPVGEAIGPDTQGHCCWPQQVWSVGRAMCVGVPVCPPGFAVQGEACVTSRPSGPRARVRGT